MTKRIFRSVCLAAVSVLAASVILFLYALYDYFSDTQQAQLRIQTDLVSQGVDLVGKTYFEGLDTSKYRITWINADGTVLYDSDSDAGSMENHLEREEIQDAFKDGYGESRRYSSTLMQHLLYCAERLSDGTVVRLSISQNSVFALLLGMSQPICVIILAAVALSVFLAVRLSRSIVNPLNKLNLDEPLENEGYDELSPLLRRIDAQQKELKKQSEQLQSKKDELNAVIESMNEGIVLLNQKSQILSINRTAKKLLEAPSDCLGKDMVTVCRNLSVNVVLEKAMTGVSAEKIIVLQGRSYQVDASPIISDNTVSGAALLLFDVTERENAEQIRREFTANVSHELKTPLQSISGYAELMANGMVKKEDYIPFAKKIHTEAQRMIQLVEDIINLSRLDETSDYSKKEPVDVFAVANSVVESLKSQAEQKNVTLELSGEPSVVSGIYQLIYGIVYNLCDNAIKYNRKGGKVAVSVAQDGGDVVLSVSDTGIGIAPEHQSRIFERFYRVDKSRSKEVGGTGLGLSIVKHAAKIHNARVELKSAVGEGTTVTVKFTK